MSCESRAFSRLVSLLKCLRAIVLIIQSFEPVFFIPNGIFFFLKFFLFLLDSAFNLNNIQDRA